MNQSVKVGVKCVLLIVIGIWNPPCLDVFINQQRKEIDMTIYLVLVYDIDEGRHTVYADYDNDIDASETASECNGIIRTIEV